MSMTPSFDLNDQGYVLELILILLKSPRDEEDVQTTISKENPLPNLI
jgi:hypothetical protein